MFAKTLDFYIIRFFSNRIQAEAVLETAKNVSKALEEADVAQTKALQAISTASSDISLAHDDLAEVYKKGCLNCKPQF